MRRRSWQVSAPPVGRATVIATLLIANAVGWGCGGDPIRSTDVAVSEDPVVVDPGMLHATAVTRRNHGLLATESYVRDLLMDPVAVQRGKAAGYDFPVTEPELDALEQRARSVSAVTSVFQEYAVDHAAQWAGLEVEDRSGTVVAYLTGDLEGHRAALAPMLHPTARYELRGAEWSLAELQELRVRVRSEEAWFASVDAQLTGTGVSIADNRTVVDVSSERVDIVKLVQDHFDAGTKIDIRVGRFGPAPWIGGRGDLLVIAEDENGFPVPNLDCNIRAADRAAWEGDIRVTDDDGRCSFKGVGATDVMVTLRGLVDHVVLDFGHAATTIKPGDVVVVTITVERSERPN